MYEMAIPVDPFQLIEVCVGVVEQGIDHGGRVPGRGAAHNRKRLREGGYQRFISPKPFFLPIVGQYKLG